MLEGRGLALHSLCPFFPRRLPSEAFSFREDPIRPIPLEAALVPSPEQNGAIVLGYENSANY